MQQPELSQVEWHDLPVRALSLSNAGVELLVTPFDDDSQTYLNPIALRIQGAITLDIQGIFSLDDLKGLEITSFEFTESSDGKLDGKIEFLLGWPSKLWSIAFAKATWSFTHA